MNEEIDHFMELLRPAEPEFYNKYFAARIIKDMGVRHRQNGDAPSGNTSEKTPVGAGSPAK